MLEAIAPEVIFEEVLRSPPWGLAGDGEFSAVVWIGQGAMWRSCDACCIGHLLYAVTPFM